MADEVNGPVDAVLAFLDELTACREKLAAVQGLVYENRYMVKVANHDPTYLAGLRRDADILQDILHSKITGRPGLRPPSATPHDDEDCHG